MKIEGWQVALGETFIVFTLLVLGFFVPTIQASWKIMGPYIQTIYPLSLGAWFAYKAASQFAPFTSA